MDKQLENQELTKLINLTVCLDLTPERKKEVVDFVTALITANNE